MRTLARPILVALVALGSSHLVAGQEPATSEPAPPPEAVVAAPAPEQRVVVHGYLSQAYARSQDHQLIGIPENGTFDYHRVAVIFRGNITRQDTLVVQLAQRRLGDSPAMALEPDVKLDWAFYEHRFGTATRVRVGRMPTPLGIYSEIRYVGTLLPFYRAPYNFYQEGSFTSENVDGVEASHTFAASRPWNLELSAFGGGFSMIEAYFGEVNRAHTENALGGQAWLNTPVEGLRVGFGGDFLDLRNTILGSQGEDRWTTWIASFDLSRTRYRVRAEYSRVHLKDTEFLDEAYYVYGGVNVTEKLTANVQYDNSTGTIDGSTDHGASLPHLYQDTTLGLSYAFRPDVVAKAEYHFAKGRLIEDETVPLDPAYGPYEGNYFILSLSASF